VATVFGSTGFLGRYVVNRFCRVGTQVVAPYRGEEKHTNHLKVCGDVGQVVPFKFSIRDMQSIESSVAHSNVVVNVLGRNYNTRNFTLEEANVESARSIALASKKAGVKRFIHVSCVGASEDSRSHVLRVKAAGEKAVKEVFPDATILRLTQVFGSEDKLLNKLGYLTRFSRVFLLPVRSTAQIQPIYVGDCASAVMSALSNEDSLGKTYELGGPEVFTFREFVQEIIFDGTKNDGILIKLPPPLNKAYTWATEQTRKAIWTQDEINYYEEDHIVPPNVLTLQDLNVKPTDIDAIAVGILRQYRKPLRFDAE
jgi:NADH dehydrogenase (ubiquinone) 1 alpha subcomplex subunit 9